MWFMWFIVCCLFCQPFINACKIVKYIVTLQHKSHQKQTNKMKSKETTPNENTNSQATTAQNDEILRPNDVAKMLGLKVCSVYRMTSKREIPFYKPTAKTLLFKKSEILEWIEKHKIEMA